jgi:hypothetical protein
MGNLIGAVFGKPSGRSKRPENDMCSVDGQLEEKERSRSPVLSKRPSLNEIIALCPSGKPVEFTWTHGGHSSVIVTGSFDNWSSSIKLAKDQANDMWRKTVLLEGNQQYQFKYIVDGVWRCSMDWDTITDAQGNVNNVIFS